MIQRQLEAQGMRMQIHGACNFGTENIFEVFRPVGELFHRAITNRPSEMENAMAGRVLFLYCLKQAHGVEFLGHVSLLSYDRSTRTLHDVTKRILAFFVWNTTAYDHNVFHPTMHSEPFSPLHSKPTGTARDHVRSVCLEALRRDQRRKRELCKNRCIANSCTPRGLCPIRGPR